MRKAGERRSLTGDRPPHSMVRSLHLPNQMLAAFDSSGTRAVRRELVVQRDQAPNAARRASDDVELFIPLDQPSGQSDKRLRPAQQVRFMP